MLLAEEQVSTFERDGFLFPIDVRSSQQAAGVQDALNAFAVREGLPDPAQRLIYNRHLDNSFIRDIACDPTIVDAVESLLGPNILMFGTRIICKWPGEVDYIPWHQDLSAKNKLTPPLQVTAWYAVDDADEDNGGMWYIPGSHKQGMLKRYPATSGSGNLLRDNDETPVSDEDIASAVPLRLRAGQVSLHHGFTLHSSPANSSKRRRCGLVIRYVPAYVDQSPDAEFDQRAISIVVRGADLNPRAARADVP